MHSETRSVDRTVHYTMKTARSAPPISLPSPHASSHPYRTSKSGTPLASPRMLAYSVGQAYPPKLPPGSANRPSPGAAQEARSSSPSYFGLMVDQQHTDVRDGNWSPPLPSVKSLSAAIPKQLLPLDANPAYDAFRRQADAIHAVKLFHLGAPGPGCGPGDTPMAGTDVETAVSPMSRPRPPRRPTPDFSPASDARASGTKLAGLPEFPLVEWMPSHAACSSKMDIDTDARSARDSAYASGDSNKSCDTALEPTLEPSAPQCASPAQVAADAEIRATVPESGNRRPCPVVLPGLPKLVVPLAGLPSSLRTEAAATANDDSGLGMMSVDELKDIIENDSPEAPSLLLLDVRVSTYYTVSRIRGALSLCIPTTLLKRATFNLQKMQLTFARPDDQAKFAAWRTVSHIVVYDSSSYEKRDAVAAMNMLRKFTNEGYQGKACALRGGFKTFEAAHPDFVDQQMSTGRAAGSSLSLGGAGKRPPAIAPIIGGVMLPGADAAPTPFFSNIRQNMDLADGVGRLDLTIPAGLDPATLPLWLRAATDPEDHGRRVSERFLGIELAEQSRMRHAYAAFNPSTLTTGVSGNVQLCGIEKGAKNRYKDILPFEHSRVRLAGRSGNSCDYVNASHIRASRSTKRYIASQGPLPATFEDFWSVIWDQDVRVIVMLTAESEGGQLKCHPYWTSGEYGAIKLRMLSEKKVSLDMDKHRSNSTISGLLTSEGPSSSSSSSSSSASSASEFRRRRANTLTSLQGRGGPTPSANPKNLGLPGSLGSSGGQQAETPFVVIRKFALSHSKHPFQPMREVTQLHFSSWPDFGAPAQPSHLLALVELANVMQRSSPPLEAPAAMHPTKTRSPSNKEKLDHIFWPWPDDPETNVEPRPMLVHCSAGCGRTGTFCTVDAVVDMLKRQRQHAQRARSASATESPQPSRHLFQKDVVDSRTPSGTTRQSNVLPSADRPARTFSLGSDSSDANIDTSWLDDESIDLISKTVEDFRTQRLSMVQSLRQFVLCYETVTEWVAKMQQRQSVQFRGQGRARSESLRMPVPS